MCDYKPWWIFISVYLELKLRLLYTILLLVNSVVACCVNTVILDIVLMSYFHNSLSMLPTVAPESAFICLTVYMASPIIQHFSVKLGCIQFLTASFGLS